METYLAMAIDLLEMAKSTLPKSHTGLISEIETFIEDVKRTEKNICAGCDYSRYHSSNVEPPTSTCACKDSEYFGDECPIFYGDEYCRDFKTASPEYDG